MENNLTIFTVIPGMYRLYPEFQLCLRMFRDDLPEGATLVETKGDYSALRKSITDNLVSSAPYILIVKEPAVLLKKGSVEELLRLLETNPQLTCILPSDTTGHRRGKGAPYHTLRGFERFADSLYDPDKTSIAYDGRKPWMLLVRKAALQSLQIPPDPLDIPSLLKPHEVAVAMNAYIHPFIDYDSITARTDVLPLVPEGITSLLDIGCHTGNFAASVKERLKARVVGSEINPQAAEMARTRLDAVTGDILNSDLNEEFDCVTCLDVIEHFVNVDSFLLRVRDLLRDDGYFLLSVPNVGHWSIIEDLLEGHWDYMPAGTLCISHVRFFTRRGIEALLRGAGFRIISVIGQTAAMPEKIAGLIATAEKSGIGVDKTSLSSLGYYILAQKTGSIEEDQGAKSRL